MDKVKEFLGLVGTEEQDWMYWKGWDGWVGCDVCAGDGPEALCWGHAGCHGYLNGCGCAKCMDQERKEAKEVG